jgi:hypothetical protein
MTFSDLRGLELASWPTWGEPPQPPSHALQPRVQSIADDARQAPQSGLQERTDLPSMSPRRRRRSDPNPRCSTSRAAKSETLMSPSSRARFAPKRRAHPTPQVAGSLERNRRRSPGRKPFTSASCVAAGSWTRVSSSHVAMSFESCSRVAHCLGASTEASARTGLPIPSSAPISLECHHSRSIFASEMALPATPETPTPEVC